MFRQTVETSATPHITVAECLGDLVVRGAEEQVITLHLQDGADQATLEREGEVLTFTFRANCVLGCPVGSTLTVHTVRGNLRVTEVRGTVAIGTVHGNVNLRAVGPSALEQISGNLTAADVAGDLSAQMTEGNARLCRVAGLLSLDGLGGNLRVEGLEGGLETGEVEGSVQLGPPFCSGGAYEVSADGNLTVRLPTAADLSLILRAGGKVHSHVPGLVLEERGGETRGVLGAGEAKLQAHVGGNVSLWPLEEEREPARELPFNFAADMESLGAQIEAHVAELILEMEARLEESLGRFDDQAIRQRARRRADKEAVQARREAEQEAEQARIRAERAERRWRRASGRRRRPRREAATDEERLRVLRLVEKGKITPDQGADLLAALKGR